MSDRLWSSLAKGNWEAQLGASGVLLLGEVFFFFFFFLPIAGALAGSR